MVWWILLSVFGGLAAWAAVDLWQLRRAVLATDGAPAVELPEEVVALARRMGAVAGGRVVRFRQAAEIEMAPGKGWKGMTAWQVSAVRGAAFLWLAWMRPVPVAVVVDAFAGGRGALVVRLAGLVPVARGRGPEIDRAEAMRYLAELPWVPDAVLGNGAIRWEVLTDGRLRASLGEVSVVFTLEGGEIVEVTAQDRPSVEGGKVVLRDWRGVFSEHGEIGGRRVPLRGEVGYMREGVWVPYYRGRIVGYEVG